MTTGNKIMWKRGEIAHKEQFLLFSILFCIYIFLTSGVKLHIHLLNVIVQFIVFLTLSTLICRCMDISKCFSESLGFRDNESRLYYAMYIRYCFCPRTMSNNRINSKYQDRDASTRLLATLKHTYW